MKGRESGMPDEAWWSSFFDADCILRTLQCAPTGHEVIAEFGCGYGTFTLPAARITDNKVYTFDIEASMVARVTELAQVAGIENVQVTQRDFLENGTGLDGASIDHVMIYNLLHIEESLQLLQEATRIMKPGGTLSIIHWNPDPDTPRGPPMAMRPTPTDCQQLAEQAGLELITRADLSSCCEHHYGLTFMRPP